MKDAELIARLEAAAKGSRELDAQIDAAIHGRTILKIEPSNHPAYFYTPGRYWYEDTNFADPPAYTTSLDAAVTLVPEGWTWQVSDRAPKPHAGRAYLTNRELHTVGMSAARNPAFRYSEETAVTPALALCVTALHARATSEAAL